MSYHTALVTGATGFIGRHVVKELEKRDGLKVVCAARYKHAQDTETERYCDIEEPRHVEKLMKEVQPDIVFHLAANPIVKESFGEPFRIDHTNILATHYLLNWAKPNCRFVYCSSAAVYGSNPRPFTEFSELLPMSVYGATKLASEELVRVFGRQGRVHPVIIRPVANVGPGATHGVLLDLLKKLLQPAKTLELLGEQPGTYKPYAHVTDTARGIVELGLAGFLGVFNLAPDDSISVASLAVELMKAVGIKRPLTWAGNSTNWQGDTPHVYVDSQRAQNAGWKPKYRTSREAVAAAAKELFKELSK